jgi:shikimate dehydrogenase
MRRFGLIGHSLTHSFSKKYFTEKFKREGLTDCVYENYPIPSLDELPRIISDNPDLEGINVTIPYKKSILPFLDSAASTLPIAACNCIRIAGGKLKGYNTDIVGFEQSLKGGLRPTHRKALILGTGGSSEAVRYVLGKLGITYQVVSREPRAEATLGYGQLTEELIRQHPLIVNTTPLGMFPAVDRYPPIPYEGIGSTHYLFDLIYNPEKTIFLEKGERHGATIRNGAEMLVLQAEESWRIWNS